MDILKQKDTLINYHDPQLPHIPANRGQWSGMKSIAWTAETLVEFDAAVVCTAHSDVDYLMLAEHVPLIVDTCNIVPKQMRAQVIAA